MNIPVPSRARRALVSAWRRHWPPEMGWPVAVAVALLLLAGLLQAGLAPAWRAELAQLQAARPGLGPNRNEATNAMPAPWPAADQAPKRLADLLELALREGLDLRRSRERLDAASASYVLEMQVRGSYESMRSFLALALAADPALALERLQVQRPAAEDGALSIEMQWRLLHQPNSGSRPLLSNAAPNAGLNAGLNPNPRAKATAGGGMR